MKNVQLESGKLHLGTQWGPFSRTTLGISRILNDAQGTMADLSLFVARKDPAAVILPDNIFGYIHNWSGDHRADVLVVPEDFAPDYSTFSLRYLLDSHGDTALARFAVESADRVRCEITFCNTSDAPRTYSYGLGLSVVDPRKKVRLKESLRPWWVPACKYASIESYRKTFSLGNRQGVSRNFDWKVEEGVLAQAFGGWPGDRVSYRATLPASLRDGFLYFRYVKYGKLAPTWEAIINGRATSFSFPQTWAIPGGGLGKSNDAYHEWRLLRVPVGRVEGGDIALELRPVNPPGNDHAQIWLDGILFSEGRLPGDDGTSDLLLPALVDELLGDTAKVELESASGSSAAFRVIIPGEQPWRATIETEGLSAVAGQGEGSFIGSVRARFSLPPPVVERDAGMFPWGSVDAAPVTVPARSERTVRFTFALDDARARVAVRAPKRSVAAEAPRGPYGEMIARMRDSLLYNINYPMNTLDGPSPIYVPAKHFPVPYSWDGGFVALGMSTYAPELALQQAYYFMVDARYDVPLLYCASPVPTMLYALWDIYQRTQDPAVLTRTYAAARRMYDFYFSRTPGSIVNAGGDGLLSTYPYYGNLGMDDHPIQLWAEKHHVTSKGLYSLILIPQILRIARIMRNVAILTGRDADAEQSRRDAELLEGVIDGRMWDEESGLYGWLCRTERGVERPEVGGCRGDRSAVAFLPLFAGVMTHRDRLIPQMMDSARFFTPNGVSSMDMKSPIYNPEGYWNGGIWPVLQWYLWRGLIEAGEPALARQVAEAILGAWQRCYSTEHYLGEHFCIARGRMSGAPNFGGLSAALLPLHEAYYAPYAVTTRYDVVCVARSVDRARDTLTLSLRAPFLASETHDLLVNMGRPKSRYAISVNGRPVTEAVSDDYGHFSVRLPRPAAQDEVVVRPSQQA